jgi:hypothetical protein
LLEKKVFSERSEGRSSQGPLLADCTTRTEYTEKDGDNIPLPLLGAAWIGLSADTVRMSTKATLGTVEKK